MRVVILSHQIPFVFGGAELLARNLKNAVEQSGHEAALLELPMKWYPPAALYDSMLAAMLTDVSESAGVGIDRVIGLKFPAYLAPHPNKVLWIVHQHREAYDLWDRGEGALINSPGGAQARALIHAADNAACAEARGVFTIAGNVSKRLAHYNGVSAEALYSPPDRAESFYPGAAEDFLFFPSRISGLKRQELALRALSETSRPVRLALAGPADQPSEIDRLRTLAETLGIADRVIWHGSVSHEAKIDLYARCLGVLYPPLDEDYGYVTLEAMLAAKPVITTTDSGGPTEFVRDGETGLVAEPAPKALAAAMDRLWDNRTEAGRLGEAGRQLYAEMPIGWSAIVERLLAA